LLVKHDKRRRAGAQEPRPFHQGGGGGNLEKFGAGHRTKKGAAPPDMIEKSKGPGRREGDSVRGGT